MATTKTKQVLSKEQHEILEKIEEFLQDARFKLNYFDAKSLAAAGFLVGQAYVSIDQAKDLLDELLCETNYND